MDMMTYLAKKCRLVTCVDVEDSIEYNVVNLVDMFRHSTLNVLSLSGFELC